MSAARRSWSQRREDRMAATMRTPQQEARMVIEGQRLQRELIDSAERDGVLTHEQAESFRARIGGDR